MSYVNRCKTAGMISREMGTQVIAGEDGEGYKYYVDGVGYNKKVDAAMAAARYTFMIHFVED